MNDPRGSIWRKWDLHVHTPSSYGYGDNSVTNESLVEAFKKAGISAIAITDHFKIDVDRILQLQELAGTDITIFPGIELRSELGGSEQIHYIGIFPESLNKREMSDLWTGLSGKLGLTSTNITKKGGIEVFSCPLKDTAKTIHDIGGIVTVHAGKKSNSIESLRNSDFFRQIQKKDLVSDSIDILEIGRPDDESSYKDIVFPKIRTQLPLIICSDNHNINDYTLKSSCWIKADPTFEGLNQIKNEPKGRVFIGDEPKIFEIVRNHKTKYISSISFKKNPGSTLREKWFEGCNNIPINPELVAIIGNKGSGKSALSDTIGLLGNSKQQDNFSFLCKQKFCDPMDHKAEYFTAYLKWEDQFVQKRGLAERIDDTEEEMVSYIPQNYLETICSAEIEGKEFYNELRSVIFSHIETADRLGCSSLKELIATKTNGKKAAIEIIKERIHNLNLEIIKFEEKLYPNHKQELDNKLKLKKAERAGIEEPLEVKKPDAADPKRQAKIESITKKLAQKQLEIERYTANITKLQTEKIDLSKKINNANILLQKLKNFQQQFDAFHVECDLLCSSLGIAFEKIANLEVNTTDIKAIKATASTKLDVINKELREDNKEGPIYKCSQAKGELEQLKAALDEDNKNYQKYLKDVKEWKKQCEAIEGTEQNPEEGTIWYYQTMLKRIAKGIPDELEQLKEQRSESIQAIYGKLGELKNDYEQLYVSVKEFMKSAPFSEPDKLLLDFNVSIECKRFLEKFFYFVAQNKKGSFRGVDEGKDKLRAMLDVVDFNTYEGLKGFLKSIDYSLVKDMREEIKGENREDRYVIEQLGQDRDVIDFYDYLYGLDYLLPEYNLQWSGKKLNQLSPGERGLMLLIFYLFIDKKDNPLLIDQPEENLDNESIYKVLVRCIKEAKKKRQIIIVTHNPNLAVVCDAEQIIYTEIDKQDGNKITYTCGAIENPTINKKLIDVLEGTRPAFDKRDDKYYT